MKGIMIRTICGMMLLVMLSGLGAAQAPGNKEVEVFGQKIHYLEAGSGPVVILLHGLGGDVGNWAPTIPALSSRYRVIAIDQIGFGKSAKPVINYRVSTLVAFLGEFYARLGITKASLVGNSLGGWTAVAFALAHPEKVDRLVLVDAAGYSPQRTGAQGPTREMMISLNPATPDDYKRLLRVIFANQQIATDELARQAFAEKLQRNDGMTINLFIESLLRGDDVLDGKLGAIKAPTLIIWGRDDALTPLAIGKAFNEDIKGSELFVIDRCGHAPQLECAEAFNQAVTKFLAGAQAASSAR